MSQTGIKLPPPKPRDTGVRPRRWTRKEYYQAAECGLFKPGERLELLDGEILQKMSPQTPPHATLRFDRKEKREAYARSGIPEYWIENLPGRQLEVYRDPSGQRYRSVTFYSEQEAIAPLAAPQSLIRVADLLLPPDQEQDAANGDGE